MKKMGSMVNESLKEWLSRHLGQVVLVSLFAVFVMGPRLFLHDIGIDTGLLMKNYAHYDDAWMGSGRFGLVFSKKLFGFSYMVPFASGFLTILFMVLFVTLFIWMVDQWGNGRMQSPFL